MQDNNYNYPAIIIPGNFSCCVQMYTSQTHPTDYHLDLIVVEKYNVAIYNYRLVHSTFEILF